MLKKLTGTALLAFFGVLSVFATMDLVFLMAEGWSGLNTLIQPFHLIFVGACAVAYAVFSVIMAKSKMTSDRESADGAGTRKPLFSGPNGLFAGSRGSFSFSRAVQGRDGALLHAHGRLRLTGHGTGPMD